MSLVTSPTASAPQVYPGGGDETFGQLKYDVCSFYGVQDDPDKLALAGRIMRRVIDDLNRKQVWVFNLITSSGIQTTPGVDTIPLPADFWKTYNARKADNLDFSLSPIRQVDFDNRYQTQVNITGYPYLFVVKDTFRDGTVQLFPKPDAAYQIQIRYFKLIARPTVDTDLMDLPRPYQNVPYYGALSQMGALMESPQQMSYWKQMYDQSYAEMSRSDEDSGYEALRFANIEEGLTPSYLSPNVRPRAYDLF